MNLKGLSMVETYVLLSLRRPRPSVASAPFLSPVFPMWCSSSLITWEWPYLKNISIERGTGEIGLSTIHRHHIPHQHESKYQTDHPKYLAQKWRGVSLCRLHTLIEAPFSKRRLTTCDWTMDIVTVLVREEYLRVAITRCQKQWGAAPAVFQAQHLLSSLLSFQQLLNARQ